MGAETSPEMIPASPVEEPARPIRGQRVFAWALGALLLYAALMKMGDFVYFCRVTAALIGGSPERTAPLAAGILVWEIVTGIWLLIGWRRRTVWMTVLLMFTGFTGALVIFLVTGRIESCGCFGEFGGGRLDLILSIIRNGAVCLGAALIYIKIPPQINR